MGEIVKTTSLSKLEKVDLRNVWLSEPQDFTPWLAQKENLLLLSNALSLDLQMEAVEKNVGPFRADILCRDGNSDRRVLIENQLEESDHRHLGQILTYAAGLDARLIIWVVKKFTDEHRAAVDWLNSMSKTGEIHFFGVEIELWRIENSNPAPKFNVIVQPNEWKDQVLEAAQSFMERRPPFRFSLADIPIGAELQFIRDEKMVCKVINDRTVEFLGERKSLSAAASELLSKSGRKSTQVQGPIYWLYEGETLEERRQRIEVEASALSLKS